MATLIPLPRRPTRSSPHRRPQEQAPLRIGLFADSNLQPRWMVDAFARIADSSFAEVVLVAVSHRERAAKSWMWMAWNRMDHLLFSVTGDPSEPADLRAALPRARQLTFCRPPGGKSVAWRLDGAGDQQLDVAFVIGELDDCEFEHIARYGVWRYCFGATYNTREDMAGCREVLSGAPVTHSGLRVHLWRDDNRLLYQSRSRTYPFSMLRNRTNLFRKTALFAERELRMLHRLGSAYLKKHSIPLAAPASGTDDSSPDLQEILRGLTHVGDRIFRRSLQKLLCIDQWFIAYRFGAPGCNGDLSHYTHLLPPRDRIWADPFPLYRQGRYYIFFEEVLFSSAKGHISMVEVDEQGKCGEPVKVLERDYHLSYPFLIERDGELFMVPESGQNRSVEVYRCVDFPKVWQLEKVLLQDFSCADATFHRTADHWWMFVNSGAEGTELYDELHLFYANDLFGDWHPHPHNPVKSDVCGARPAGRLYMHNGILHRPAQICAPLYGSGVSISQVLQLSPRSYVEAEVARVLPIEKQGVLGIHTMNRGGNLNVVDGFARRSRL